MPDPINYQLQVQQPFQAALQGYQAGAAIRNDQVQQQQTQLALTQQQLQMQRGLAMQQAAAAVAQNPTPQAIAQLSIAFPEISKQLSDSNAILAPAQQQARISQATPVYAAMQSGRPDVAAQLLNQQADAMENSGDAQGAQHARVMAQWAQTHPDSFKMAAGMGLAAMMGPDKFADTFKTVGPSGMQTAQAGADKATAEAAVATGTVPQQIAAAGLKNADTQSQIDTRAAQLGLDRDKLASETELKLHELELQYGTPDAEGRKTINDAATDAAASEQTAARLNDLASRVDDAAGQLRTGAIGTVNDAWNKVWGGSNGQTALKQEIARVTKSTAVEQLRAQLGGGGRFTDTDMKVALGSAPNENSDPALVSSYFRGVAKLQQIQAAQSQARAEWLSQVRHLGKSPRDIQVMGTTVPAGTTFADFSRQFTQAKATQIAAQSGLAAVQGRSYMRFAQPGAVPASSPAAAPARAAAAPADSSNPSGWPDDTPIP